MLTVLGPYKKSPSCLSPSRSWKIIIIPQILLVWLYLLGYISKSGAIWRLLLSCRDMGRCWIQLHVKLRSNSDTTTQWNPKRYFWMNSIRWGKAKLTAAECRHSRTTWNMCCGLWGQDNEHTWKHKVCLCRIGSACGTLRPTKSSMYRTTACRGKENTQSFIWELDIVEEFIRWFCVLAYLAIPVLLAWRCFSVALPTEFHPHWSLSASTRTWRNQATLLSGCC